MHHYLKLSHPYMFRHYRVILIDYKLPEDDTMVSKHVGV